MSNDRREFMRMAGATAAVAGAALTVTPAAAQIPTPGQFKGVKALAFDAYGTLFDVFSVTALCEQLFPGKGNELAQTWRFKQLQYSLLRSVMDRFEDFWQLTGDGLVYAAKSLELDLADAKHQALMDAYLRLAAFPDVKAGLEALKAEGRQLTILSNGAPRMLQAAVASAGLGPWIDAIISVNDIRIFKPSPRVYQLIGQKLQVPGNQIGFVSSNSWDINGAGAAGLYTFWIQRRPGEPEEELGFPACQVVTTLTELAQLIR